MTCEAGECYLFSFKEVDDEVQVTLQASYKNSVGSTFTATPIEVVKFHPKSSVPIMVFAAARHMKLYVVDYTNYNVVQTINLQEDLLMNNGLEFSVDGRELFAHYIPSGWYVPKSFFGANLTAHLKAGQRRKTTDLEAERSWHASQYLLGISAQKQSCIGRHTITATVTGHIAGKIILK